ncbi:MAG: MFS transporter [Actinobacteria bacterium]|nr:MFS transporter [Actinomycetota bacterium]
MTRPTPSTHPPSREADLLLPTLLFALTLTAVAPAFLVGAFARDLMDDLGFRIAELGLVGSMYTVGFGVGALTGRYLWRGWPPDLALFLPGGVALLGGVVVARADSLAALVVGVTLAGVASSVSQTISTHLIASRPAGSVRAATVFSAFQSAKPAAAVVVGLLSVIGLSGVGWREVFLAVGVLSVVLVALVQWPTRDQVYAAEPAGRAITLSRWIWRPTVLMGLGFAITSISTTFIVEAAQDEGLDARAAGLVLLGSGCLAVVGRITAGLLADRPGVSLNRLLAWLFALGGLGCALIATGGITSFLVGVCLVFGPGWAFGGVILARVSMHDRARASQSAGALFLGAALGGALGPAAFGLVVAQASYGIAWAGLGVFMLVAGWVALTWRLGQADQTGAAHRTVR